MVAYGVTRGGSVSCSGWYRFGALYWLDAEAANCRAPQPTVVRWGGPAWHGRGLPVHRLNGGTLRWMNWLLPGRAKLWLGGPPVPQRDGANVTVTAGALGGGGRRGLPVTVPWKGRGGPVEEGKQDGLH